MGTFDFLSGLSGANANQQAAMPAQQYQQFWGTGQTQGMDYSQVLGGGQASPATQGLDFGKIGQWALQQNQYPGQSNGAPSYAQALQALQGTDQQSKQQPWALPQPSPGLGGRGGSMQAMQSQSPGFIGRGTQLGLLGMNR